VMDQLERLLAERACERLVHLYALYIDEGRAGEIASLFTEDGRWEGADGGVMDGRAAIAAAFGARAGLTRRTSMHVCANVLIDVADHGATATGTTYLMNYRYDSPDGTAVVPAPANVPKFVGIFYDRFVCTAEDGWLVANRRFSLIFLRRSSRAAPPATPA
jgi:SnoaL-like domain